MQQRCLDLTNDDEFLYRNFVEFLIMSVVYVNIILLLHVIINSKVIAGVDLTIVEDATGPDVVAATIAKIEATHIYASDKRLLHRIAYVEMEEGQTGDNGGIWKVSREDFEHTKQDESLDEKRSDIAAAFPEINDWELVQWEDLNKPLWSALAARLVILQAVLNNSTDIPALSDSSGQAAFWNTYYNVHGNASHFQMIVEQLQDQNS